MNAGALSEDLNARYRREESAIAQKYMQRFPWEMVVWGLGNTLIWMSLWPLVFAGALPLWAGFLLSTLCCTLAYLPSHDAQHQSIAKKGTRLHWLNELVGHFALLPLVLPYKIAWIEHREHHANANNPELDPDYCFHGKTIWASLWNATQSRQPWAQSEILAKVLERSNAPNIKQAMIEALVLRSGYYLILAVLAWSGFAIEAFFLWWLPRHLGYTYITTCLGWAPHFPYEETGRYRDTRAWKSPIGTVLSLGMEYHQVHHLFPRIPLFQTAPAYWELRELLQRHGARDDRPDAPAHLKSAQQ